MTILSKTIDQLENDATTTTRARAIDVRPIPPAWEQLRRKVASRAGRHAIIAGGAIRDHVLGLPIKDIDVFVLGMSAQAAKEIFNAQIIEYAGVEEAKHQYQEQDGLNVDLVFSQFDNVLDVLKNFDLGICRIAWDGWDYVVTKEFERDFEQKRITTFFPSPSGHRDRVLGKLKTVGFALGDDLYAREYVRNLAAQRGYRLMHRRNGEYWLMPTQPMSLEDVIGALR